jgi:hypothetical protein
MVSSSIYALGLGKQSAQGSAASAAAYRSGVLGGGLSADRTIEDLVETATSAQRLPLTSYVRSVAAGGTPELAARPELTGALLYAVLGAQAVSGGADPYSHTLTPGGSLVFWTLWDSLGAFLFREFRDCQLAQLVLTSEAGQPLKLQATVMGLDPRSDSTDSQIGVAVLTTTPYMHFDSSGAFLVDGVVVSCVSKAVITINNNTAIYYGDSVRGCSITLGRLAITAELTHQISNATLYNLFHYGTASPADATQEAVTLYQPAAGIDFKWTAVAAAPGPERSLQMTASRVQLATLAGYDPNPSGDPLVDVQTYRVYDPGTTAISFVEKNGRATVY